MQNCSTSAFSIEIAAKGLISYLYELLLPLEIRWRVTIDQFLWRHRQHHHHLLGPVGDKFFQPDGDKQNEFCINMSEKLCPKIMSEKFQDAAGLVDKRLNNNECHYRSKNQTLILYFLGTILTNTRVSFIFQNGPTPASSSFIFGLFKQTTYNVYNKSMWKMSKSPSSIRRRDSNPQPFKHESSSTTTRPGINQFNNLLNKQEIEMLW